VADESFFKGDPVQVMLACSDRAQVFRPNDSRLLAEQGRAYLAAGQRARAEALFAAAVKSDRNDPTTHRLIAESWLKAGEKGPVPDELAKAKTCSGYRRDPLFEFAVLLMDHGMKEEALTTMERGWWLDHEWEEALTFAGACLRAGLQNEAAEWMFRGISLRHKKPDAWHDLAKIMAKNFKPAGDQPLPTFPSIGAEPFAPKKLSKEIFLQDPRLLMVLCTNAFRSPRDRDADILAEDAAVRMAAGDRVGADQLLQQVLKAPNLDGDTLQILGDIRTGLGDTQGGLALYQQIAKKDPGAGKALVKAGLGLLRAGLEAEAIPLLELGAGQEKENFTLPMTIAQTAFTLGRTELAAKWFARSLCIGAEDWRAWNDVALGIAESRWGLADRQPAPSRSSGRIWLQVGLKIDVPEAAPPTDDAARAFNELHKDRRAFMESWTQAMQGALPEAKSLMAPGFPANPESSLEPSDRVVRLESFSVHSGLHSPGKVMLNYVDASLVLGVHDGQGHRLRGLTFMETTEPKRRGRVPSGAYFPQPSNTTAMGFPDIIRRVQEQVMGFLRTPAFQTWVR
jgi:tetratricopeptide (TPR) repeat protein